MIASRACSSASRAGPGRVRQPADRGVPVLDVRRCSRMMVVSGFAPGPRPDPTTPTVAPSPEPSRKRPPRRYSAPAHRAGAGHSDCAPGPEPGRERAAVRHRRRSRSGTNRYVALTAAHNSRTAPTSTRAPGRVRSSPPAARRDRAGGLLRRALPDSRQTTSRDQAHRTARAARARAGPAPRQEEDTKAVQIGVRPLARRANPLRHRRGTRWLTQDQWPSPPPRVLSPA